MSDRNEYIESDAEEALRIFEAEVTGGAPKEWAMETAIKAVRAIEDHCARVGDGTPGPAPEAAPEETARQLAQRWRQEAKEHESRFASDLLLLCAIELECALRAELGRAPNVWEEAAKVCEEAQAEMKGTRWSGAAACIRALRARADAERPPQETK